MRAQRPVWQWLVPVVVVLLGLMFAAAWGVARLLQSAGRPSPRPADRLPEVGRYAVGISGRGRAGKRTAMRGLVLAVYPRLPSSRASRALAEALAIEAEHLHASVSVLPQSPGGTMARIYAPDRDDCSTSACLTREQGLAVARELGQDAVLVVEADDVPGGARASVELVDMGGRKSALARELSGRDGAAIVEQYPATFRGILRSAGLSLTAADEKLLSVPPFPAADYVRAGRIEAINPSRAAIDDTAAFLRERPDSALALSMDRRMNGTEWGVKQLDAWIEHWLALARSTCPSALLTAALAKISRSRPEAALELLAEYDLVKPRSCEAALYRIECLWTLRRYAEAIAQARVAVEANPLGAHSWSHLAQSYWIEAREARGGRYLARLTRQELDTFVRGVDLARPCFEQALKLAPLDPNLLADAIEIRRESGDRAGCEQALDVCDTVRPGYEPAYESIAWLYTEGYENDVAAADKLLRRAAAQRPSWPQDEISLAYYLKDRVPFDYWMKHYRRAVTMLPPFAPVGLRTIAQGVLEGEDLQPDARRNYFVAIRFARECLERSQRQYPSLAARGSLAKALLKERRFQEAEAALAELVRDRPEGYDIRRLLGNAQRNLGHYAEAAATYHKAWRLMTGPDVQTVWDNELYCRAMGGQEAKARVLFGEDLRDRADSYRRKGPYQIGLGYLAVGDVDRAERTFGYLPPEEQTDFVWDCVAVCRMQRGDWEGGLKAFEKAAQLAVPGCPAPKVGQAVCHFRLGHTHEARAIWNDIDAHNFAWLWREQRLNYLWPPKALKAWDDLAAACTKSGR
jgi:tetratricopeptide (TPR) repeat protein